MSQASVFNPARHPRGPGGVFVDAGHSPGSVTLGWAGAPDLELIDELGADIRLVAEPLRLDRGMTREQEDEAYERHTDARRRIVELGGIDHACIAVGEMVTARAETLAGITAGEIASGWGERVEAAEAEYAAAQQEWLDGDQPGGPWRGARRGNAAAELNLVKDGRDPATMEDMRRMADGYLAALSEVRPMGGDLALHAKSSPGAVEHFRDAAAFYPTDWIESSNAYNPLLATLTTKRAHYADRFTLEETAKTDRKIKWSPFPDDADQEPHPDPHRAWKPTGKTEKRLDSLARLVEVPTYESTIYEVKYPWSKFTPTRDGSPRGTGWEQWEHPESGELHWRRPQKETAAVAAESVSNILVGGRSAAYVEGRSPFAATAIHELAHRFEKSVAGITTLEARHGFTRTNIVPVRGQAGEFTQQKLEPIRPRSKEKCRPDHYADRYMGREYANSSHTEFLSVAMESMFAGTNGGLLGVGRSGSDRESRDMALGILATASGSRKQESGGWNF